MGGGGDWEFKEIDEARQKDILDKIIDEARQKDILDKMI